MKRRVQTYRFPKKMPMDWHHFGKTYEITESGQILIEREGMMSVRKPSKNRSGEWVRLGYFKKFMDYVSMYKYSDDPDGTVRIKMRKAELSLSRQDAKALLLKYAGACGYKIWKRKCGWEIYVGKK